jgi:hypothetical protein
MAAARAWAVVVGGSMLAAASLAGPALAAEEDCPDIGLVPELTRLTQFKEGQGRTLDDIAYDIVISAFGPPACRDKDRFVNVAMRVAFSVQRGRNAPAGRTQFSYFVAIMHRVTKQIIAKEVFPVAFDFPQGRGSVAIEEELEQVRFRYTKDEKPIYYAVLVGLQLNEEQLAYNRLRRGESPDAPRPAAPAMPVLPGFGSAPAAPQGQAPAGQAPVGQTAAPAPAGLPQAPPQAPAARPTPVLPQLPKPN